MILTEEEAKTKRCQESYPAAQGVSPTGHMECGSLYSVPHPGAAGGAYTVAYTAPYNCIGSACMAWRWTGDKRRTTLDRPLEETEFVAVGYCGKAGKP